jgi:cobalt-precorrin-5B (C1)-methyltransferase
VDFEFLAEVSSRAGADSTLVEEIRKANTASQVGDLMAAQGHLSFFEQLSDNCCLAALKEVDGGIEVDTTLYTMKGELLGKAERNDGID